MKVYKHTGAGHYIGSCIIVIAKSMHSAEKLIKEELIKQGLINEEVNIEKIEIEQNKIIYSSNGDY